MKKKSFIIAVICVFAFYGYAYSVDSTQVMELNLQGGSLWGGVSAVVQGNTITFNGILNTAGYNSMNFNSSLRNRIVILEIRNANTSSFSEGRMLKITVNRNDQIVIPLNISSIIYDEYVPSAYERIEFLLPPDFDGKIGFVFFQAELNNLQITAYYK
jgi:hypothetical protein